MGRVDHVIRCVDVVASHDHFEDFGLVHVTLFHKVNDFVVDGDVLVLEVLSLYLQFVPQTSLFGHEFCLVLVGEFQIVFGQKVQLIDVDP